MNVVGEVLEGKRAEKPAGEGGITERSLRRLPPPPPPKQASDQDWTHDLGPRLYRAMTNAVRRG